MLLLDTTIRFWKNRKISVPALLWILLTLIAVVAEILKHKLNNYYIFKGVFWHTLQQTNLYNAYPAEYSDVNHYGPFFSVVIAPFAVLPNSLGVILWCLANCIILIYAVQRLPLNFRYKSIILLIAAVEMMTSMHNVQANPFITALIVLAFIHTEEENDFWAGFFIAAGFFIKIYGIVGLLFFVFSKHKWRFAGSFLLWCGVFFLLPMLFSSPGFIVQSYVDWYNELVEKNNQNMTSTMQNISLLGFLNKVFNVNTNYNLLITAISAILVVLPLLRFQQYKYLAYRLSYLAMVLLTSVLLSSSSESSTYIIAVIGGAIVYVIYRHSKWMVFGLVFMLLITSLATTDLFPAFVRNNYLRPYHLKALPCIYIWFMLLIKLAFNNFSNQNSTLPVSEAYQHRSAGLQ